MAWRFAIAILCFWTLVSREAAAEESGSIAIVTEGPGAKTLRAALTRGLPQGLIVVEEPRFRAELGRAGLPKGVGAVDEKKVRRIRKAANATGAQAVVIARVIKTDKKGRTVRLVVIDAVGDLPLTETATLGPRPADGDGDTLIAALHGTLDRYVPAPPEPPPEPVPPPPEIAPEPPPPPATPPPNAAGPGPAPAARSAEAPLAATGKLDVALGFGIAGRHSDYDNGFSIRPYAFSMPAVPGARLSGRVFPLAPSEKIWGDLGSSFELAQAFAFHTDNTLKEFLASTSYSAGLRGRFRFGERASPRVVLGAAASYAVTTFETVGGPSEELQAVIYRAIRPSVDVRVALGARVSILAGIGFRLLVAPSSVSPRFPDASGYGFDGDLGIGVLLVRHLEVRLLGHYERYALSLPAPPHTIARDGDVSDQHYGAVLALALLF